MRKAFLVEFFGGRVVAPAAAPWALVRDDALRLLDDCELRKARDVIAELDGAATAFLAAAYAAAPPATRATMAGLALRGDGFSPGSNGLRALRRCFRVAGPLAALPGPAVGDGDLVAAAAAVERSRAGRNASATRELLEAFVPLLCAARPHRAAPALAAAAAWAAAASLAAAGPLRDAQAVSYTHLTLPTKA